MSPIALLDHNNANLANPKEVFPLSQVVDILDSKRVPVNSAERSRRPGSVPYYGATGQAGVIDTHIFDEELVLLGEDGAPFLDPSKPKAYLISGKSWVNNHAHVLRGKPGLTNKFLLYQLNALDYKPYVSGTTRLKLPQGPMKLIPIWAPDSLVQDAIVAEIEKQFSRLDAGIAALKRAQANLKRYRASVLKAACEGRLVPTEAETAKNEQREFSSGADFLAHAVTVRRENAPAVGRYKEPELPSGEIIDLPEGWAAGSLDQLFEHISDGDHQAPPQTESGVPFLVISNVRGGSISFLNSRHVSPQYAATVDPKRKPKLGDILYTLVGSFGIPVPVDTEKEFCIQRHIGVLRPHSATPRPFMLVALKSKLVFDQAAKIATGTAQMTVPLAGLRRLAIPIPPPAEQERIVAEVERLLSVADAVESNLEQQLARATRLRQTILAKVFGTQTELSFHHNKGEEAQDVTLYNNDDTGHLDMDQSPVNSIEEFVERLTAYGKPISPNALLRLSGLSDDIDRFYELLREGRNSRRLNFNGESLEITISAYANS